MDQEASPNPASPRTDEFFIGWLAMPRGYAAFLRPVALALLVLATLAAIGVAWFQRDPGSAEWDPEDVQTFEGLAIAEPYAMVVVRGVKPTEPPRTMLLVEEGKFGAAERLKTLLGPDAGPQPVRVSGTLLHREGRGMLELAAGETGLRRLTAEEARSASLPTWPTPQVLKEQITLRGEIIDPKCYLGAMKPGGGKTHKACAMLCITGGIPPMLVTRHAGNRETFYLLTTADGGAANVLVLPFVGDQVEATGRVEQLGDLLVIKLANNGVRRR